MDATAATIRDIATELIRVLLELLDPRRRRRIDPTRFAAVDEALGATRNFAEQIRSDPTNDPVHWRHLASLHALDHLLRLSRRCAQEARIAVLASDRRLRRLSRLLRSVAAGALDGEEGADQEKRLNRVRRLLREQRRPFRNRTVMGAARQRIGADAALRRLDSIRWLHRVAYHLWRIVHHLRRAEQAAPQQPPRDEAAIEVEDE